jgi:hypothetical protein
VSDIIVSSHSDCRLGALFGGLKIKQKLPYFFAFTRRWQLHYILKTSGQVPSFLYIPELPNVFTFEAMFRKD